MTGHWDDLTARLTRRLAGDRELQLDVRRELHTHLEDAAAEFRDAGETPEAAASLAARALGEEGELEEQLWSANRFRMRVRGLLWWAARVALLPGAIAVIVLLILAMSDGAGTWSADSLPYSWRDEKLSADDKVLLGMTGTTDRLARAKAAADRWPDDPAVWAAYVTMLLDRGLDQEPEAFPLEEIRHGQQIDPDNGWWNLLEADVLLRQSSRIVPDGKLTYPAEFSSCAASEACDSEPSPLDRLEISDTETFERAIEQFYTGLDKPLLTHRGIELACRRADLLPEATRLTHILWRWGLVMENSLGLESHALLRDLCNRVDAYAVTLAGDGQWDAAVAQLHAAQLLGARLAGQATTLIDLLVATAIRMAPLAPAEVLAEAQGHPEFAEQARRLREAQRAEFGEARPHFMSTPHGDRRRAGAYWLVLLAPGGVRAEDAAAMRNLEYAVGWELALMVLLVVMVLLALLIGLGVLVSLLRRPRPVLLFVGWRRLGRICLFALVLPLAIYAFYAAAVWRWGGGFGVNYAFGRVLLEITLTAAAVIALLLAMGYAAICRRAAELGFDVGGPRRLRRQWVFVTLAALVGLVSAVYIVGWWAGPLRPEPLGLLQRWFALPDYAGTLYASLGGAILAAAVASVGLLWLIAEGVRLLKRRRSGGREVFRNLLPILSAGVILVGLACGWALSRVEATWASRAAGQTDVLLLSREIESRGGQPLRRYIVTAPLWPDAPAATQPTTQGE